jgi:hypothetical protein
MHQNSEHNVSSSASAGHHSVSGITTDVIEWMRHSGPRSLDEVELLRKGMRKKTLVGFLFERHIQESQSGRELWYIKGHNNTLSLAAALMMPHVYRWSKGDFAVSPRDVRFAPECRHWSEQS